MVRLGQVEYINCIPVYQALEEGQINLDVSIVKGAPTKLNKMFIEGELDITPISSIEYAQNVEKCFIIPNLSISANGEVRSILLFSKVPVTELEGKRVALPKSSATSVVLLKILLEHYYHVNVEYIVEDPSLEAMLEKADAALLIGDDALVSAAQLSSNGIRDIQVTDLGDVWKQFTGEKMVYALWVIRKEYAEQYPEMVDIICDALISSTAWGHDNIDALVEVVQKKYNDSLKVQDIKEYFEIILHEFTEESRRALLTFYDYAYKSGLIEERVRLQIWGEGESDEISQYIKKSS